MDQIVTYIGSLGFPIVACIILFRSMEKERESTAEQREADRKEHSEEMKKITDALNNNTLVMQKLIDALTADQTPARHS